MTDSGRAQDQGRSHKRQGAPSRQTARLLVAYQGTMRREMSAILAALNEPAPAGLLPDAAPTFAIPLDDPRRDRLWDRAVKLARELGTEIDLTPAAGAAQPARRRSPRKVDFGGA